MIHVKTICRVYQVQFLCVCVCVLVSISWMIYKD